MGRPSRIGCAVIGKAHMCKSQHEECDSKSNETPFGIVRMATPGDGNDINKDLADKGNGTKEPPAKMVRVDELEASIKQILERTLRKATQEHNPLTEKASQDSARCEKSPCQ